MPETAQLAELATERAALDDQVRDARITVDDLTKEQKRAERDVEQVRTRRTRDQQRMDAGQVTNPKDLTRMQHELVSLDRRISELEDTELEVMEQLEAAQATLDQLSGRAEELEKKATSLTAGRGTRAAEIEAQLAQVERDRAPIASGLAADLVALYTKVRDQKGGVGAAALRARRCGGCSLELNPADIGVIAKAPSDEVLRCEECNRILVRTSESGI